MEGIDNKYIKLKIVNCIKCLKGNKVLRERIRSIFFRKDGRKRFFSFKEGEGVSRVKG